MCGGVIPLVVVLVLVLLHLTAIWGGRESERWGEEGQGAAPTVASSTSP